MLNEAKRYLHNLRLALGGHPVTRMVAPDYTGASTARRLTRLTACPVAAGPNPPTFAPNSLNVSRPSRRPR